MDLNEKRKVVEENHEAIYAALTTYLDKVYNLTDKFFEEDGKHLKKELLSDRLDEKLEDFIISSREEASKLEKVRSKIGKRDFELSLVEINYAGLALTYVIQCWINQIDLLGHAKDDAEGLVKKLFEKNNSQGLDKT